MDKKIKETSVKGIDLVKGEELVRETEINKEEEDEEKKSLNERIEDLVNEMERNNYLIARIYSLRSAFLRGTLQGLGIIIGSTILAGALYSMTVRLFGNDFLRDVVLDNVIEKYNQEK